VGGNLKVFCGPFEALEDAFARRLGELSPRAGDKPLLVVAPSRALADRLERLLAVERGQSLLGVHFHTFHSLAAAISEDGGFPDGALIADPLFHDAVVDQALDEAPSLGVARELRPRALAAAVRSSLRDLVDAGVDAQSLAENFGDELLREEGERARFIALLSLLAVYEKKLAKLGVLPSSALVKSAAALAPASKWLASFAEIIYYGFYDLTGLQSDAFEAVTSAHPSRLYFPYRAGHPAFRFAAEFFDVKLAGRAPVDLSRPGGEGAALGPALDALFDPAARPVPPSGSVAVISASGARDEAWAAAKEASRWLEEGVAPGDIAVVARTLEPYRAALVEAFAAEGLPLDLSGGEPILRQPLAKAALDLLSLRRRDFPASVVEDLSSSPYFASASTGRAALWRRLITALGVRAGWLQWRGKLEPRAGGPVELYPHRVREGLTGFAVPAADVAALWEFVSGVRASLGGPAATWSKRADEARALLAAHLEPPRDASAAEGDAWRLVMDALDETAAFDRLGSSCAWEDFLDIFERKLSRATRSVGEGGLGVRALDAMDARGQRFRAVIVVGLKEKLFPRQVSEDPILRDAARSALRHPGGYWIGRKAAGHEEERLLFYLTVASARERLALVYPRSDEAGRAEVPSTYLRELCRAAGLPPPGEDDARRVPRPPAERLRGLVAARRTPAETALLCALDGGDPPAALEQGGVPARALAEGFALAAALNAPGPLGPRDGLVPPPAAALAAWRKSGLSPTALDEFAQCPFKFFAGRVLGLGEREEGAQRGELTAQARGQVYHSALERFYRTLPEGAWSGRGDALAHLEAVLVETFAENDWRALGLYPLLWEASRLELSAHLRAFVAWDFARLRAGGYRPRLFEARLSGEPEGGAPGGVPWRGIADRVDADAGGRFRVIDYKTRESGRWKKGLARLAAEGESHQIPFYAALAGRELGDGWSFAGGELLFLESPDDEGRSMELTPEDWKNAREPFMAALTDKIERISAGRFPISPEDGERGHCSWCEFPTVCRKSHGPTRARAMR
jgi:RecB family exonuclease